MPYFLLTSLTIFSLLVWEGPAAVGRPAADVPDCLPASLHRRITKETTSFGRLRIYASTGRKQLSMLRNHLRWYRPWMETDEPSRSGETESILDASDCVWGQMLAELRQFKPGGPNWRVQLEKIYVQVVKAYGLFQEAAVWAPPHLQARLARSRTLIEDVKRELGVLITAKAQSASH
jgi:hypothetical protein